MIVKSVEVVGNLKEQLVGCLVVFLGRCFGLEGQTGNQHEASTLDDLELKLTLHF